MAVILKYLGIDYGLKRVGLAFSEGELASVWKVIEIKSLNDALEKIAKIIQQEKIDQMVIGIPGGEIGKATSKFVSFMKKNGYNIVTWDETLSTRHAQELMIQLGKSKKSRKINDAYSAAEILQNYLDSISSNK